jgi:hypothetical protein
VTVVTIEMGFGMSIFGGGGPYCIPGGGIPPGAICWPWYMPYWGAIPYCCIPGGGGPYGPACPGIGDTLCGGGGPYCDTGGGTFAAAIGAMGVFGMKGVTFFGFRRRKQRKKPIAMAASTTTATPIPIPAFAPVESPPRPLPPPPPPPESESLLPLLLLLLPPPFRDGGPVDEPFEPEPVAVGKRSPKPPVAVGKKPSRSVGTATPQASRMAVEPAVQQDQKKIC